MKKKILLPVFFLFSLATLVAQRSSMIYVISSPENQTKWMNIQMMNAQKGEVVQTVFDPSVQKKPMVDVSSNATVARITNGIEPFPTSTMVAAAAYDGRYQQFFFIPMRIPELRWADVRQPASPNFYSLRSPVLSQLNLDDAANHITRMVIAADKYGYALTNDGNHLFRFTTGKEPKITDLGNLVDAASNTSVSVHSQCSSWGGDMVAGTDGNLFLISHNRHVFKFDPDERIATYMGVIKGLPEGFHVNGSAADQEGRVIVSCSFGNQPYYYLDLETLDAKLAFSKDQYINASDLASANLAKRPAINKGQYITGNSPFALTNQKIALYPNPVTEYRFHLNFEETGTGVHHIQVMDLSGKILLNKTVTINGPGQYEGVELQQTITKGLYLVKVINSASKTVYTSKFIVE